MRDLETLLLSIIILIVSFTAGVFFGLSIVDKGVENKLCKQLYTKYT